jgi:Uma2 family endonuclease
VGTVTELFTRRDYLQLPEGFPAQLVEGFLVKDPSPTYGHQWVVGEILVALYAALPRPLVRPGPVDVPIDEHNVYVPDVAVYAVRPPDAVGGTLVPRVVFEILSPSTASRDRDVKRRRYLDAGVEEVWLVDAAAKAFEVHRRDGSTTARGAEAAHSAAIPGFAPVPDAFFATGA